MPKPRGALLAPDEQINCHLNRYRCWGNRSDWLVDSATAQTGGQLQHLCRERNLAEEVPARSF